MNEQDGGVLVRAGDVCLVLVEGALMADWFAVPLEARLAAIV